MPQKVIIDADPGIGDAVAIALALLDPEIDVLGVTAVAGRVSGRDATRNVQTVVELLDPPKWPRVGACEAVAPQLDVDYGGESVTAIDMNGSTGMGDCEFRVAELHHPHESAKLMIDIVRLEPNEVTLLTLGPLTNVEMACERAPEFLSLLKGIVCLGGSVRMGGDVTAAAEFNIYANPEAARLVLRSPATKTLVPLDVSSQAVLTFEQFDRLLSTATPRVGRFLKEVLPYALRAHHQHLGLEGTRLHEVVALAGISQPQLFKSRAMAVDVETRGDLTRGMTVFDRRGTQRWQTNIDVLDEVDVAGLFEYLTDIVSGSRHSA